MPVYERSRTVVIPTTRAPIRASPGGAATSVGDAAGVLAAMSGAIGVAVQQGRLQNAMQLAACGTGEYLNQPMDTISSPLQLVIGEQPLAYQRGSVVGNIVVTVAAALLFYLCAAAYAQCRGRPISEALMRARLPGLLVVPGAIILGGAGEATGALLGHGTTAADFGLGAVGVVFLIMPVTLGCTWVVNRSATECKVRSKSDRDAAAAAATASASTGAAKKRTQKASPSTGGSILGGGAMRVDADQRLLDEIDGGDNNGNGTGGDDEETKTADSAPKPPKHCVAANFPRLYAAYRYLAANHSEWKDVNPALLPRAEADAAADDDTDDDDDDDGGTARRGGASGRRADIDGDKMMPVDVFTLRFAMIFEDYGTARFALYDLATTAVLGVVAGVSAGVLKRSTCLIWLSGAALVCIAQVIALIWVRPMLNRMLMGFMIISNGVTMCTTIVALGQFVGQELDYPTTYLSLNSVQAIASVIASALNFLGGIVILTQFVNALRRGKQQLQMEPPKEHLDFRDLFADLDMEMLDRDIRKQELEEPLVIDWGDGAAAPASAAAADSDIDLDGVMPPDAESQQIAELDMPTSLDYDLDDGDGDGDGAVDDGADAGAFDVDETGRRIGTAERANAEQLLALQRLLNHRK